MSDEIDQLLGPEGPIASAFATQGAPYEQRDPQMEMGRVVARALSSGRHALIEAGTGVGKSFAYLVPALRWAARTGSTVAVATSTIALQEQLVQRDLPLLESCLPFEVSYALVKGRGNYLCTRRLHRALADSGALFDVDESSAQLAAILEWSRSTREGSQQDLDFRPRSDVWEAVRAEQGNCMGRACAHYTRCHYQRSRRRAHAVRLLVLNHHVLLADLALRRSGASFLPEVQAIVIDEAHDFADTASEHLGLRVSSRGVLNQLARLWSARTAKGLLAHTGGQVVRRAVESTRRAAERFFPRLAESLPENGERFGGMVSVEDGFRGENSLTPRLNELAATVAESGRAAPDLELGMELASRARGIQTMAEALEAGLAPTEEGYVRWAERGPRGALTLCRSPVDVGPLLKQVLWDPHETVILTSATLSTGNPASFGFMQRRLGLEDADTVAIGSPFQYQRQARLRLRTDLPDPASEPSGFEAGLAEAISEAVLRTDGGAFVLFTAYESMRRAAAALRGSLEADGYEVLVQGEALERSAMLERFRAGRAVLFGVSSFWQGVDVPGAALRHVIIARLPFEVPSHPLQAARSRQVRRTGGDAFRDLSLPMAALRLKQGFGRLIRRADDEGVVTILDPRIVRKAYGRVLLDSLPECPVELVPDPQVEA